jgi:hypothetical protein
VCKLVAYAQVNDKVDLPDLIAKPSACWGFGCVVCPCPLAMRWPPWCFAVVPFPDFGFSVIARTEVCRTLQNGPQTCLP